MRQIYENILQHWGAILWLQTASIGIDIQGISRVTGYLSLDERFGPGKFEERADRRSHTGSNMNNYGFI